MKNRGGKKKQTKKTSENSTNQEILPARGASAMLLEGTKQHTWTWDQFLLTLSSIITAVLVSTEYSHGGHRWHTQYISYYSTSLHLPIFPLIFFIFIFIFDCFQAFYTSQCNFSMWLLGQGILVQGPPFPMPKPSRCVGFHPQICLARSTSQSPLPIMKYFWKMKAVTRSFQHLEDSAKWILSKNTTELVSGSLLTDLKTSYSNKSVSLKKSQSRPSTENMHFIYCWECE